MKDLKESYSLRMRCSLLVALALIIVTFVAAPVFTPKPFQLRAGRVVEIEPPLETLELTDVAEPPPRERPALPVEAEPDEEIDAQTIDPTAGRVALDRLPPPPETGDTYRFIPHEKDPVPKDVVVPEYPEIAKKAGIEGTVLLHLSIDENGKVTKAYVAKSVEPSLDRAALEAVKKTTFYPALQRDKPVAVWVTYRVNFRLRN